MKRNRLKPLKLACALFLAALAVALTGQVAPVFAQSESSASDQDKAIHYSLYYEDFKNENYQSAVDDLRWMLEHAPLCQPTGQGCRTSTVNFERGIELYAGLAEQTSDPAIARAYLDTALVLFDNVVPTVKDAGGEIDEYEWTLQKGRFIQSHPEELADLQAQVIPLYREVFEMDPSRLQPYYIQIIVKDEASRDPNAALALLDEMEQRFTDNQEVQQFIVDMRNVLKSSMSPEDRIAFLQERIEAEPQNLDLMKELFDLYREEGMRDEMYALGERLQSADPSNPTVTRMLAQMSLSDGDAARAFEMYEELTTMPGVEVTADDYFNMGLTQREMGSLAKARTYFRQALEADPNYGNAYIAIGDLYVEAIANCGSFEREDRAVYWLVTDLYARARNVDPSVAGVANQKIGTYSTYYPTAEDKFFKGWEAGQSYPINYGCYAWIGETTTIK